MRGAATLTLQPVVANAKEAARQEFAKLFNEELDRVQIPRERARVGSVHKALRDKGKPLVSREQVRKWVKGIDIPDQGNLWVVCKRLKLDWTRLQPCSDGTAATRLPVEFHAVLAALNENQRMEVLRYARLIRLEAENNNEARAEGNDSEVDRAPLHRRGRA